MVTPYAYDKVSSTKAGPPSRLVVTAFDPLTPLSQLRHLFSSFGSIEKIANQSDPATGSFLGVCLIQYKDKSTQKDGRAVKGADAAKRALTECRAGQHRIGQNVIRVALDGDGTVGRRIAAQAIARLQRKGPAPGLQGSNDHLGHVSETDLPKPASPKKQVNKRTLADRLEDQPHIYLAKQHIPVVPSNLSALKMRLKNHSWEAIESNEAGYFVIFPATNRGRKDCLFCFDTCSNKTFSGYVMDMKTFNVGQPLSSSKTPNKFATPSKEITREERLHQDWAADVDAAKWTRAQSIDPVAEAMCVIKADLEAKLVDDLKSRLIPDLLVAFLNPDHHTEKRAQLNLKDPRDAFKEEALNPSVVPALFGCSTTRNSTKLVISHAKSSFAIKSLPKIRKTGGKRDPLDNTYEIAASNMKPQNRGLHHMLNRSESVDALSDEEPEDIEEDQSSERGDHKQGNDQKVEVEPEDEKPGKMEPKDSNFLDLRSRSTDLAADETEICSRSDKGAIADAHVSSARNEAIDFAEEISQKEQHQQHTKLLEDAASDHSTIETLDRLSTKSAEMDTSMDPGKVPPSPTGSTTSILITDHSDSKRLLEDTFFLATPDQPRRTVEDDPNIFLDLSGWQHVIKDSEDFRFVQMLLTDTPSTLLSNVYAWAWRQRDMKHIDENSPCHHPHFRPAIEGYYVANSTGSARSEGTGKILESQKSKYLPHRIRVQKAREEREAQASLESQKREPELIKFTATNHANAKGLSRASRVNNRRLVADIEAQRQILSVSSGEGEAIRFNQLKKRKKPVTFARSSIHNWGLYAVENISANDMIIEYVGEKVRQQVADVRERRYLKSGIGSSYLFRIDENTVIDATKRGGIARFINHSCTPNCTAKIIRVEGSKRIVIYALRDVMQSMLLFPLPHTLTPAADEELTYDYKFEREWDSEDRIPCLCGSAGCKGFLN